MDVKHIDHFNIRAPRAQLKKVKKFYTEVLGLKEGFRPELSGPGQWLYADSKAIVHLSEDEDRISRKEEDFLDHIALRCVGVNEFAQRLKDFSIKYRPAIVPEIGVTQLFIKDPAGIIIELNFKKERLLEK